MPPRFINELKELIQNGIPTDSTIISRVVQTIYSPKTSANDLAQIIECDPPLTAKILKAANSAYYGQTSDINSLRRAVVTLGFETIKELVTAVTVSQLFFADEKKGGLNRQGLWMHSIGAAKAAQIICNRMSIGRPDVMYTAGLLHDIGKIVLSLLFPDHYSRVITFAASRKCRIILAEQRLLNTDHCMVGKVVCELWNLPEDLANAIFYHNDPREITGNDLTMVRLTHLSDALARKAGIGDPGDQVVPEPSPGSLSILGNTRDKIVANYAAILADVTALKPEIETFFADLHKDSHEQ